MRRTCFTFLVIFALLVPATTTADPHRDFGIHPSDEKSLMIRGNNFRKSLAMAVAVENQKIAIFAAVVEQNRYDEEQRARVEVAVQHNTEEDSEEPSRIDVSSEPSSGRCGGDLPDCSIMECESGGSLTAQNPSSSASGKWQVIDGTWNNYGGYGSAAEAPESVQDAKARELWAGGSGASHWQQCR
jgi:hypothetical protein